MGHERIGFIPKTKQWQLIVEQLQNYNDDQAAVAKVAADTLDALRGLYDSLPYEPSLIASIRFLSTLCRYSNSTDKLRSIGVEISDDITMYSLLHGINQYLSKESDSIEIGNFKLEYVLGVMNSKLTDFVYYYLNPEMGEALAEVKKAHVEMLPIPFANEQQQAEIAEIVTRIIEQKKNSEDSSENEKTIDALIYQLYNLTPEEIDTVENYKK